MENYKPLKIEQKQIPLLEIWFVTNKYSYLLNVEEVLTLKPTF